MLVLIEKVLSNHFSNGSYFIINKKQSEKHKKGGPAFRMSIDPSPTELLNVDFSNYMEHKKYMDNSVFSK